MKKLRFEKFNCLPKVKKLVRIEILNYVIIVTCYFYPIYQPRPPPNPCHFEIPNVWFFVDIWKWDMPSESMKWRATRYFEGEIIPPWAFGLSMSQWWQSEWRTCICCPHISWRMETVWSIVYLFAKKLWIHKENVFVAEIELCSVPRLPKMIEINVYLVGPICSL